MQPVNRARHSTGQIVGAVSLFLLTFLTTATVGSNLAIKFAANRPAVEIDEDFQFFLNIFNNPGLLVHGIPFALTLMTILLAHEMGHYVTCIFHGIDSTPPYFLPSPLLTGTFGAFIRLRSPIYAMKQLFDVGIAGPLAGFVVLVPALAIGVSYSRVIPGLAEQGDLLYGTPLLLRGLEALLFPGVATADISLHPIARAAWVGMFATALNLLPIGQLDGGHILYSFFSRWFKYLSRGFALLLIPAGFYWTGWIAWGIFFLFTGWKRPTIYDTSGLDGKRRWLGVLAAVVFLLCFSLQPIREGLTGK